MRRALAVLVFLLVGSVTAWAAFDVPPYQPVKVTAKAPAYQVKADLSNVVNRKQFGKFTALQKKLLTENGFFASPASEQQLYFVYEDNDYKELPSFVASDAVLQLYHIFYDYSLREVEAERLIPLAKRLTQHMLEQSVSTYKNIPEGPVREAALKNVAYFGVAARLLGLPAGLAEPAKEMVAKELETIGKHEGRERSAIFPYKFDFSQFVPRGHYTRNEEMKRYFKTMMWYGLVPLALEWPERKTPPVIAYEQIRQSLLITRALYETELEGKPAVETWDRIYEPTAFYVEFADDLTPAEWREAATTVWGHLPNPGELADEARLKGFHDRAMAMRQPKIATFPGKTGPFEQIEEMPTGPQFRFMGQRVVPDSYVLQQLVWSNVGTLDRQRRMPKGLDVFAAFGSQRALRHLEETKDTEFLHYPEQMAKVRAEFFTKQEEDWRANLYWGWLWVLKAVTEPAGDGYPTFMRNDAWLDKQLNTALASWAELRHDTILYAKQSVTAECGDGEQPRFRKGYVEPSAEVYHRLLWLTQATRKGLKDRNLLTPDLANAFDGMADLLTFLERVSLKELSGEALKRAEHEQIRVVGAEIEHLTAQVSLAIGGKAGELITEADEDIAVVADVHSDLYPTHMECLEEGVGHANHIFVVVPIEGKLCLARGATFSYYEFKQPIADRLTDEKWQRILAKKDAPKPPYWTSSFLADRKAESAVPSIPITAGSGC
jgi:hypothetical protein